MKMKLGVINRGEEMPVGRGKIHDSSHSLMKESMTHVSCNENKEEIKEYCEELSEKKDLKDKGNSKEEVPITSSAPIQSKKIMLKFYRIFSLLERETEGRKIKEGDKSKSESENGGLGVLSRRLDVIKDECDQTSQIFNDKMNQSVSDCFTLCSDGTHFHTLRRVFRRHKFRFVFRDLFGGSTKKGRAYAFGNSTALSYSRLINSWIDKMKPEKLNLSGKEKNPANSNASLAEKYGNCHEVIGKGTSGVVRISYKTDPQNARINQLYAVKEFRRRPAESRKRYTKRLTSEFCISSALRHPNVIHTLDLLQDSKGDYCEVMEFCAGGDLYSLILSSGKLNMIEADCYFKQLMRGVEYMHEMGVAHRDLKPENLLLTHNGVLKITDFGNGECFRMAWEKKAHLTYGLCGSIPYIAPEEYIDKEFDPRPVDVWATGLIYMAMRTGQHLWRIAKQDEDEFYEKYLQERKSKMGYEPIESLQRSYCKNVIYSILDPCPQRRITAKHVLRSEWGKQILLCKASEIEL